MCRRDLWRAGTVNNRKNTQRRDKKSGSNKVERYCWSQERRRRSDCSSRRYVVCKQLNVFLHRDCQYHIV